MCDMVDGGLDFVCLVDSEAHHSFGKELVGQHWRLALAS